MATSASLQTVERVWLNGGRSLDIENYVIHCNSPKLWRGFCGHIGLHVQPVSSSRSTRLGALCQRKQLSVLRARCSARKSGKNYSITLLPGDGIRREIIEVAVNVLKLVGKQEGIKFKFQEPAMGGASTNVHGAPLPVSTLESCQASDAVLSTAIYRYDQLDCESAGLRAELRTTAELCPVTMFPQFMDASRRGAMEGLDIMIVRQPRGGSRFRNREGTCSDGDGSRMLCSASEVDSIARMGFEIAQKRKRRLCSVDKSDALKASQLWRERVTALHKEYPDVELTHMTIDGATVQLIRDPSQFDTIVTASIFGDILLGGASSHTRNMCGLPSASICAVGPSLFETTYGSGAGVSGQDKASPVPQLLSAAMMLRYGLGEVSAASRVEAAVMATLDAGFFTEDMMPAGQTLVGCQQMGEIVMEKLMTTAPNNTPLMSGMDGPGISHTSRTLELSGRSSGSLFRVNRRGMPVMAMTKDATQDAEDEKRQLPPTESQVLGESESKASSPFSAEGLASAVKTPAVQGVGTAAMVSGAVAVALLVSVTLLEQVDSLPLLPQAMQFLGVAYCAFAARRFLARGSTSLTPDSPVKYVMDFLPDKGSVAFPVVGKGAEALKVLAEERDAAVQEMESLRRTTGEIARVVAEKEALEAVAMQLADERDVALTEVGALKRAVDAMTERMKAIEAMLEQEVQQLKLQNQALETVALQLASERDAALNKVDELQKSVVLGSQAVEEKATLEVVAMHLAQERDQALAEIDNLKQVVADLRASASGLTPQQETFIKSRAREIRSQFIDIDKSYEEQEAAANQFVTHLVEEYGAPKEWTADYMKQFLNSAWARNVGVSNGKSVSKEVYKTEPFFK